MGGVLHPTIHIKQSSRNHATTGMSSLPVRCGRWPTDLVVSRAETIEILLASYGKRRRCNLEPMGNPWKSFHWCEHNEDMGGNYDILGCNWRDKWGCYQQKWMNQDLMWYLTNKGGMTAIQCRYHADNLDHFNRLHCDDTGKFIHKGKLAENCRLLNYFASIYRYEHLYW